MQRQYVGSEEDQNRHLEIAKALCISSFGKGVLDNSTKSYLNITTSEKYCPAFWDDIFCWPPTLAGTLAVTSCPKYVVGLDKWMNNATRKCTESGEWFILKELDKYWTNYTQCYGSERATVFMQLPQDLSKLNGSIIQEYLPIIKTISSVGYTVSLCTLIIAFLVMFSIKKLHCARNKLHMNLFASFIFRAFIKLLKDLVFVDGVGFSDTVRHKDGETFFFEDTEASNWACKLVTSLFEFFITANYSWILMEGLYLHNLIFRALFTDSDSTIAHYTVLGWGLPFLVITPWVITRLTIEDTYCWTTHDDRRMTFLIIRIPTMISILVNLVLFVRITIVLFSKLRSSLTEEDKAYQKWARSTLVLVPLFGVHYALFLGMSYYMGKDETVELLWLICDQLFASFQGSFVAVLYCFLNGEVRTELKPHIQAMFSYFLRSSCCKVCFKEGNFQNARSRSSVCTMVSSSSFYNGNCSRAKSRPDSTNYTRNSYISEKSRDSSHAPIKRSSNDNLLQTHLATKGDYNAVPTTQTAEPVVCNDCNKCQQKMSMLEEHLGIEMVDMRMKDQ